MDLSVSDFKDVLFELYLSQRDNAHLRQAALERHDPQPAEHRHTHPHAPDEQH